jgi:hypothetical protein
MQMTGKHPISGLWGRTSPAARARAERKTLQRLIEEGRESGEPVDGKALLKCLRDRYAAMAAAKTGKGEGDDP